MCDHQDAYRDVQSQAVSYTTGVPAMVGATLICNQIWQGRGVFNVEEMDPKPFLDHLSQNGLTWYIKTLS